MTDAEKVEAYDYLSRNLWRPTGIGDALWKYPPPMSFRARIVESPRGTQSLRELVAPFIAADLARGVFWFDQYVAQYTGESV